jgi:hypothetical protein
MISVDCVESYVEKLVMGHNRRTDLERRTIYEDMSDPSVRKRT